MFDDSIVEGGVEEEVAGARIDDCVICCLASHIDSPNCDLEDGHLPVESTLDRHKDSRIRYALRNLVVVNDRLLGFVQDFQGEGCSPYLAILIGYVEEIWSVCVSHTHKALNISGVMHSTLRSDPKVSGHDIDQRVLDGKDICTVGS